MNIQLRDQCEKVYYNDFEGLYYVTWRHLRQNKFIDFFTSSLQLNITFKNINIWSLIKRVDFLSFK